MTEEKTLEPSKLILVTQIPGIITIYRNEETGEIVIDNPEPIKLRIKGGLQLTIDDDFDTTVNGEYNLVSHDHMMCFDSLGSFLHLNSYMSKQIREERQSVEFRLLMKAKEEEAREREKHSHKHGPCTEIMEMLADMKKRIEILEKEKRIIDIGDEYAGNGKKD